MRVFEQRITAWGSFLVGIIAAIFAVLSWIYIKQLERDRFQDPNAAPVGVTWKKDRVIGGANTVPVQYADFLTIKNNSNNDLTNVKLKVTNWANGIEVVHPVGNLPAGRTHEIRLIDSTNGFPLNEINPRDVIVIRCDEYVEKRIPVKELGKDKTLAEIAKDENKEADADPEFWPKFRRWEAELNTKGIEPTESMFWEWFRNKEAERQKGKANRN